MTATLTSTITDLRRTARDTGYAVVGATDLAITKMWEATRTAPARAVELPDLAQTMSRQARDLVEEQLDVLSRHGREVVARMRHLDPTLIRSEVVETVEEAVAEADAAARADVRAAEQAEAEADAAQAKADAAKAEGETPKTRPARRPARKTASKTSGTKAAVTTVTDGPRTDA